MHLLETGDLNLELLDQQIPAEQRAFHGGSCSPLAVKFLTLRDNETAQGFDVSRKRCGAVRHPVRVAQNALERQ